MNLSDILSNPTRMRIVQHLQMNKESTTRQIAEDLEDIPAPTIYRHINLLLKEDVLVIKEERKVRGTTERLLALNEGLWSSRGSSDISDLAYQFLMSIYGSFREYGSESGRDPVADRLCLRTCMIRLSDEKFDRFLGEYSELLGRYLESEDGDKLRSISIISSPVMKEAE